MYAVVELGGFQFKVAEGDFIEAHRLEDEVGKKIDLEKVLLFADGNDIRVGQPALDDVKVSAKIVKHHKGEKVVTLKYRRRHDSASKKGHRQSLTGLEITKIAVK